MESVPLPAREHDVALSETDKRSRPHRGAFSNNSRLAPVPERRQSERIAPAAPVLFFLPVLDGQDGEREQRVAALVGP